MRHLRLCVIAMTVFVAGSLSGCGKAAPPAAAPPAGGLAGAVGGPGAPGANGAAAPAGNATAAGATAAPAGAKVDAQIQQRIGALGAKLKGGASGSGGLTRNDLKQIGLAFHNFHDTFAGFPALNGTGQPDAPKGLSWRVVLLPYLDQSALYEQFHLDEPWDSPHNKTLITKMPLAYGLNPEGKTRVHMLTGPGMPFQNDKSLRIQEITDGTSNTILAVVGGADTAEIWTKPGGRELDPSQPRKALGNVDGNFLALMMDGAVKTMPKELKAETFASLAQHNDAKLINYDELDVNPRSGSQPGAIKINPPVTPLNSGAAKIDLSFIPADAFFAAVVHPRRIYSHPIVKNVREMLPSDSRGSHSMGGPFSLDGMIQQVFQLRDELGIALENMDEIVLVLDKSMPTAMMNNPFGPPPFGVIARNSAPLDVDGLINKLTVGPEGVSIGEHEGVALILGPQPGGHNQGIAPPVAPPVGPPPEFPMVPPGGPTAAPPAFAPKKAAPPPKSATPNPCGADGADAQDGGNDATLPPGAGAPTAPPESNRLTIAFVTDSVVMVGSESVVRKMISARAATAATSSVTQQLDSLGNPLLAATFDATPLGKSLQTALQNPPPQFALFTPYILGAQSLSLSWDLDAPEFLKVSLKYKNPDLAAGLYGMLNTQYNAMKEQYGKMKPLLQGDPTQQQSLVYVDQVVAETKFTNAGDTISLVVPKIKDLDKLPVALKPAIDAANQAAANQNKKNDLKQIGLSFHNYHDVFRRLPAVDSNGDKSQPKGLSWRVHILPFMDQATLYNRFKLDEPWDSPTNKELIKEMPKTFGTSPEGKTSIHVFTGPKAAFQSGTGLTFAAITDGLSNTFLVVQAGEDTADIWTKPGGLTMDPADPLKCLGMVEEFFVLIADGSVRLVKNIDPVNFARGVQISDGEPLTLPD